MLYIFSVLIWLCKLIFTGESSGNIRLVGWTIEYEGRVEIWYNSQWNTVCDDNWDLNDANVVCQQLGYRTAVTAQHGAHFGQGSGQILLDDLQCTGAEASLLQCPHGGINVHNCDHSADASVTCELIGIRYTCTCQFPVMFRFSVLI